MVGSFDLNLTTVVTSNQMSMFGNYILQLYLHDSIR
jgi:hypothetical protein